MNVLKSYNDDNFIKDAQEVVDSMLEKYVEIVNNPSKYDLAAIDELNELVRGTLIHGLYYHIVVTKKEAKYSPFFNKDLLEGDK